VRLESEVAALQAASRRLAVLIGLVDHPDDAACPASLDEAAGGAPTTSRRTSRPRAPRVRAVRAPALRA
jgi:hypothetical protein